MSILSPKFDSSDAFKAQNLYLLNNPPRPPKRMIKTPKVFLKEVGRKGSLNVYEYAFPSRIQTAQLKNNTVYGRYFKLSNVNPKSTFILLHGMHSKNYRYLEKHALNLARNGHNCITITLPYHIERATKSSASGKQFLSTNLRIVFEALQQAVKDVLSLVNWLSANGDKKIGLLGISLGGLIASYVSSATRKINYLVLLTPATNPMQIMGYMSSGKTANDRIAKTGLTEKQMLELTEPWDLKESKPHTPANRTLILKAAYDAIVPSDSIEKVLDAWGKPQIIRYNHSHLSILISRQVFKDINKFLADTFRYQSSTGLLK
ncbi:MAG: alpha/beta hydrolase family protein [Firmicutes bacterium]|nr:alpha/beta hydrolase family protein [Bacillota bacterium]